MDRKAAEALLRPWVGEAALPDLPLPYLVTVRLDPKAPASAPTLSRALAEAGLDATVDDHSLWRGEVERSAGVITALAGASAFCSDGEIFVVINAEVLEVVRSRFSINAANGTQVPQAPSPPDWSALASCSARTAANAELSTGNICHSQRLLIR